MSESDDDLSNDYDDEEDIDDYYNNNDDYLDSDNADDIAEDGILSNNNNIKKRIQELEHFEYQCLNEETVKSFLLKEVDRASSVLKIHPPLARLVLQTVKWKHATITTKASLSTERNKLLIESGVVPTHMPSGTRSSATSADTATCGVCFDTCTIRQIHSLSCKHLFCTDCWTQHVNFTIKDGMPTGICCMEKDCNLVCPDDFVRQFFRTPASDAAIEEKYSSLLFKTSVTSHHKLRFCPGIDCEMILFAEKPKPRRVQCSQCNYVSCFECGNPYHTPADCATIKKWLTKCADDSETANYISANTKDCPKCHICIEKNGGCNHIHCSKCNSDFCWMCLGDWKNHGTSYYECSRYKENSKSTKDNRLTQAREALKKYLFYFHRWENHNQSLLLEAQARTRIQKQIEDKVNKSEGTWIDWQYLLRSGELLAKCRYTLQYTYPLVYYAESGPEKILFEYQQAQLEVEIEDLAWKLEHAGDFQRGEIENQMDVAEKRRQTLLARFVSD